MDLVVIAALLFFQAGGPESQGGPQAPARSAASARRDQTKVSSDPSKKDAKKSPGTFVLPLTISRDLTVKFDPDPPQIKGGKIVLTATLDPANFDDPEDGITKMEEYQATGAGQPFPNQSDIRYTVQGGVFHAEVPIVPDSAADVEYSFVFKIQADKTKIPYVLKAAGTLPHPAGAPHGGALPIPDWVILVALAILGVGLVIAVIWYVRGQLDENNRRRAAALREQQNRQKEHQPSEQYTDRSSDAVSSRLVSQVSDLDRAVRDSLRRVGALEDSVRSFHDRSGDDWRRAVGDINDLRMISGLVQTRPAQQQIYSSSGREEQVLLAVVNYWINSGDRNREQMLALASELGQDVKLMQHTDVARLLSDVTALADADLSESSIDGGWLYCSMRDGIGLAAPADSRLFQSPHDRMLLQRMFEGINSDTALQFAKIYRPCRLKLKQAPNRYEIVQKGLLQLAGDSAPRSSPPPDYNSLKQQNQIGVSRIASPSTLVGMLRQHVEAIVSRLGALENTVTGIAGRSESPIPASRVSDLDRLISSTIQREIRQVEDRLSARLNAANPPAASPMASTVAKRLSEDLAAIRNNVEQLKTRIEVLERVRSGLVQPRPTESRFHEPLFSRPAHTPESAPAVLSGALPVTKEAAVASTAKNNGFPVGWQDVLARIEPFKGLEESQVTRSLAELNSALKSLPGGTSIRLVHLMETSGKFRIHDAMTEPEGQISCRVCDGSRTFQAAVCAGEDGAGELQVLLAPGDYAPYNYPAGYRQLIQNMPNQQFQIQTAVAPAVLALIPGSSPTEYSVQYKFQWK